MTALPKTNTVDAILETIQDVRYIDSLEAANANDPAKTTLFARFVAYMDAWTQSSYDAWEKSGRPEREF
jgi:hypothetical protein